MSKTSIGLLDFVNWNHAININLSLTISPGHNSVVPGVIKTDSFLSFLLKERPLSVKNITEKFDEVKTAEPNQFRVV